MWNACLKGNIRSLDPSLVFIAGMIFIRALLICCLSVTIVRIFSLVFKSALVIVMSILVMFVSNSTPFCLPYSFLERLCKPASRLGYILEFETAENRTFLVIMSIKIVNLKSILTDPNLITSVELGVIAKCCRCEGWLPSHTRTSPIPSGGELSARFCKHSLRRIEDTSTR